METIMEKKTQLRKSIKLYLSKKLKKVAVLTLKRSITPSRLRSACNHTKTPSFDKMDPDSNHHTINQAATLSDADHVVSENFQSLSINDDGTSLTSIDTKRTKVHENFLGNIASTSSTTSPSMAAYTSVREAGVEIRTLSMDPCEDFRSSIKKIVEAHRADASEPLDWEFMNGLVTYYQQLNDNSLHKHVLKASHEVAKKFCSSQRTVPSMRKLKAVEREELLESPCSYFPADFPEDFDNEQIK